MVTSSEGSSGDLTGQAESPGSLQLQSLQAMATVHQVPRDASSAGTLLAGALMMPQQAAGSQMVAGPVEPTRTLPSTEDPLQMLHSMQSHYFDRS